MIGYDVRKSGGCGGCHACHGIHCMIPHPGHDCMTMLGRRYTDSDGKLWLFVDAGKKQCECTTDEYTLGGGQCYCGK